PRNHHGIDGPAFTVPRASAHAIDRTMLPSADLFRAPGQFESRLVAHSNCHSSRVELLVIDNLSSLTVGVRENDSDARGENQECLLRLRRRGVSVLLTRNVAHKHRATLSPETTST